MLKRLLYRASASIVKRDDDKEEVMKKRIATFEKSLPIFNKFEEKDMLVKIKAEGTINSIFK
jgi:adenylate kinase family enzyme